MTKTAVVAGALALTVGIAACTSSSPASTGGSAPDASAAGAFSTGIAGTRTLGSITDSEMPALCSATAAFRQTMASKEDFCRMTSVMFAGTAATMGPTTDAELRQSCNTLYSSCVSGPGTTDAGANGCLRPIGPCTRTVADYETCMNDTKTVVRQLVSAVPSCDALTVAWVLASSGDAASSASVDPPSCQALDAECHGWLPSDVTGGP